MRFGYAHSGCKAFDGDKPSEDGWSSRTSLASAKTGHDVVGARQLGPECAICHSTFASRSSLFAHLRQQCLAGQLLLPSQSKEERAAHRRRQRRRQR
eukprot:5360626-Alexandrium_andersonii.AAC.1